MGSGKTTLGRLLAAHADCAFIDLDTRIEAAAGCSIRELFEREGEPGFRARELAALTDLVTSPPLRAVVATGGGIVETDAAVPLLRRLGRVIWLRADPEAAAARAAAAGATRPLLQSDVWRARAAARAPRYAALAEHVVSTHPESVAASLAALVAVVDATVE